MERKGRRQKLDTDGAFPIGFGARLRRFFVDSDTRTRSMDE